MAEPMNQQENNNPDVEYEDDNIVVKKKKPGVLKKGVRRFKSDISHSAQVEDNSLAQYIHKGFRSMFPKRNKNNDGNQQYGNALELTKRS